MVRKVYLVVFMLISFTGVAFGDNLITPFGSLSWEDGLLDTITKLNQMKGVEKITLVNDHKKVNLKGVATKNDLNKVLTGLLEAKYGGILKKNDHRAKMIFEKYKDKDGSDQKYTHRVPFSIEAYPIMITSVPFNIILNFTMAEGLAIYKPNKMMIERKWNTSFPLVLTTVTLLSKAHSVADNYKTINAIIEKKYRPYDPKGIRMRMRSGGHLKGCVYDTEGAEGSCLCVESGSDEYTLSYSSEVYPDRLAEIYQQHLRDLEKNKTKTKNKQDRSSEL